MRKVWAVFFVLGAISTGCVAMENDELDEIVAKAKKVMQKVGAVDREIALLRSTQEKIDAAVTAAFGEIEKVNKRVDAIKNFEQRAPWKAREGHCE